MSGQHTTEYETDTQILRERAFADLRGTYEGLIVLYDRPIEQIEKATTYKTKEQLFNALMSQISAAQEFAARINLITGAEVRALFEEYRSARPDIFDNFQPRDS